MVSPCRGNHIVTKPHAHNKTCHRKLSVNMDTAVVYPVTVLMDLSDYTVICVSIIIVVKKH